MRRQYRKIRWSFFGSLGMFVIIAVSVMTVFVQNHKIREYEVQIDELETCLSSLQKKVFVAAEKIPRGTVITKDKLWQETRYYDCPQEEFITEEHLGMMAAQDIREGSCITKSQLFSDENNVREVFIDAVTVPDHVQAGDRIDIRIQYWNAEEYIVLSDKVIKKCLPNQGMVLQLTEEEILFMSSAVSDCGIYEKTKLYVVEYPEYENVSKAQRNYIANKDILRLLGREKTEGESRELLEQRLMQKNL